MIAIIPCGTNLRSIQFALARLGRTCSVTTDAAEICAASHVILPGVGHAQTAMSKLSQYGLIDVICSLTQPVLGICLGMQLLFTQSAEGNTTCLNIIPGCIEEFSSTMKLPIPHMGWNRLNICDAASPLIKGIHNNDYVYFVHRYFLPITDYTVLNITYGCTFSAAIQFKNFYGTQFHPEKSGEIGAKILKNFLNMRAN